MLFNSIDFGIFMPILFLLYWLFFNRNLTVRNVFLLLASYVFYGFWNWRFLPLIIISSLVDYFIGLKMSHTEDHRKRKILLSVSLMVNLGILGFFKYCNFFIESFVDTFRLFGQEFAYSPLDIILPVGISFYTFQTMSYVIDIYFRKFAPTGKLINFCAFVSFFPQLVAGPIERAKNLLPQFDTLKTFNYEDTRSGLLTILFGLFKKIVVADRIAVYIDSVYGDIAAASGISLFWAVLFFTFQLYFDFSAYSDIAIGTAHILGFRLSVNFRRPYLSASYQDLWTRWHISLTSWFRDYVYIPLGGNRKGAWRTVRNVLIVFLLSGLWHGASWNFVIWGFVNALFMLVLDLFLGAKKGGRFRRLFCPVLITACWALSLVFFRAKGLAAAVDVFRNIGFGAKEALYNFGLNASEFAFSLYLLAGLIIYEIVMEKYGDSLSKWFYSHFLIRWFVYLLLIFSVTFLGVYGPGNDNAFIYFQF